MKKAVCILLSFLMIILIGMPAFAADNGISFEYVGTDAVKCEKTVDTLKNVLNNNFDLSELNIVISIDGNVSDWSVKYRQNGDILLSGGSEIAIEYAANKFLEEALITGKFSSKLDYSYSEENGTDNSKLLTYKGGKDVKLMPSYSDGVLLTPDWVDSLILVELRPDKASIGGALPECKELVDFYASVGVNGIWLPPIYDIGENGTGYSNYGPHTLEPAITGTDDYAEGWKRVKEFVDYAHSKGIYVFLDMVTWGVVYDSPLITEHPDWFGGEAWGNAAYNWENEELRNWFVNIAVENILKTGADGYRCDCEPNYTGYEIYGKIRQSLKEKGKDIVIIGEDTNTRKGVYDFEQDGVLDYSVMSRSELYDNPINFFGDGYINIVDSVKKGKGIGYYGWQDNAAKRGNSKYYINCLTNHDYKRRDVCGSEINIGYSAILAPYIPLWYMGDEFNVTDTGGLQGLYIYINSVDYSQAEDADNALFLESVKKMINIRRTYSDIFEYWPTNHRNGNICKVETEELGTLQAYARYADNKAVLVIPNNDKNPTGGTVKIPFADCKINGYKSYKITDLTTGKILIEGSEKDVSEFSTYIENSRVGIYLVEGVGECYGLNIDFSRIFDNIFTNLLTLIFKN